MTQSLTYLPVRPEWLATRQEAALEPMMPIVDSHHHLYDRPGVRYMLDDFLADLYEGHNVRATVFVQARAMLRANVPPHLQPLGETEFANGVAAMCASGIYGDARVCAGIVGQVDFTLGDAVGPILDRHIALAGGTADSGGRFRGLRQSLTWDSNGLLMNPAYPTSRDMMESPEFRAGFAQLARRDLSFDAWVFFHQLPQLTALARSFPDTPMVLDHCGGIVRIAQYTGRHEDVFREWRNGLIELARCPNVMVKLSGLGMRLGGFAFENNRQAPTSRELAEAWRPWIENCIEAFGPNRCMYGSNFPVDKGSYAYGIGVNALKRLVAGASEEEKEQIFWRSAKAFYQLSDSDLSVAESTTAIETAKN
jgi:predicted TIM-barrel fold metal-dependent hydrolase